MSKLAVEPFRSIKYQLFSIIEEANNLDSSNYEENENISCLYKDWWQGPSKSV